MKKILSLVLALCMVLAISAAFAANPATTYTKGSITVLHAANGEKYYAIKALSAVVSSDGIDYVEPIPDELKGVLEIVETGSGSVKYKSIQKKSTVTDDAYQAAMRAFATAQKDNWGTGVTAANDKAVFSDLDVGFYVIVSELVNEKENENTLTNKVLAASTFSAGNAPHTADGSCYEKNINIPEPHKTVGDKKYSIGDWITYTVDFEGVNFVGEGENSKVVYAYKVEDTLPAFLSDHELLTVTVAGTSVITDTMKTNFKNNKYFFIPWADGDAAPYTSKYANGAEVVITYKAKLTDVVNINAANTNTIKIQPYTAPDEPYEKPWEDDEEIYTYGAALKKTDGTNNLKGAKFAFKGLTVKETVSGEKGNYTVVSYDPNSNELGTEMEVDDNGKLYVIGLDSAVTLTGKETVAPDGYNLLTTDVTMQAQELEKQIYHYSGTIYYDAKGNITSQSATGATAKTITKNVEELDANGVEVINKAGTELPSTGGIGTTIFYILGGLLIVGAAIILVARRKAHE